MGIAGILKAVRVISAKKLKDFWSKPAYRDSEQSLRAWFAEAKKGNWSSPHEIKSTYGTASAIGNERIVFNICGNKYRLVVAVKYDFKICYVRFIGTHRQYDEINVKEV
jgi:mRNA interferase HigB